MNLEQMEYRCPDAKVAERVTLRDYRLVFRGRRAGNGVASILPEKGRKVDGLLWKITPGCERSLDFYEGYPHLYGKQEITVHTMDGREVQAAVYIMNERYQSCPAYPSESYLKGILDGCRQNHIPQDSVLQAVDETKKELGKQNGLKIRPKSQSHRGKTDR